MHNSLFKRMSNGWKIFPERPFVSNKKDLKSNNFELTNWLFQRNSIVVWEISSSTSKHQFKCKKSHIFCEILFKLAVEGNIKGDQRKKKISPDLTNIQKYLDIENGGWNGPQEFCYSEMWIQITFFIFSTNFRVGTPSQVWLTTKLRDLREFIISYFINFINNSFVQVVRLSNEYLIPFKVSNRKYWIINEREHELSNGAIQRWWISILQLNVPQIYFNEHGGPVRVLREVRQTLWSSVQNFKPR